jgi:uncharacterized protein (DUF433 family)
MPDRLIFDPKICGGVPVFRGTRVPLRTVLARLAADVRTKEALADFPTLSEGEVQAAIAFAAASAVEGDACNAPRHKPAASIP